MIFIIGRNGVLQYVNTSTAQQFGVRPEDLIGKSRTELFRGSFAQRQTQNSTMVLFCQV